MATLDQRGAIVGTTAVAIKSPCLVATSGANITLSGIQTIDGVSVGNANERVLVKDQTDQTTNGIYQAATGNWILTTDFSGSPPSVAFGTLVLVASGNTNAGFLFEQTATDNPVVIGTTKLVFQKLANNNAQAATSVTSVSIGTGAKTFMIQSGKAFAAGQYVVIYETSAPATNSMLATVTSYSGTSLVVNVVATTGSGNFTDWSIVLTNSQAAAGIQPPVGSGNVTGPGSAVTGHLATFADATGKVLADGGASGGLINASLLLASAVGFGLSMLNGIVVATSTDSNTSLTFAVKTIAGADPSATDPVWFIFRDQDAEGDVDIIEVTAALNTKIPAGSTLGSTNATPFAIWLLAILNAGTVELAVINCQSGAYTYPLGGTKDISTTAYGAGANSAIVPYSAVSRSSVAFSMLARASYEAGSTLAAAGTYATVPTRTRLFIPGQMGLPGDQVQLGYTFTGGVQAASTIFPVPDAVPTNTNGDQYIAFAVTPTSSANLLKITVQLEIANTATGQLSAALFQDLVVNALTAATIFNDNVNTARQIRFEWIMVAGTLASTIFKVRAGCNVAGTTTVNGISSSRLFGGAMNSYLQVQELMA